MEIQRIRKFSSKAFYPKSKMDMNFCMAVRAGNAIFLRGQTGFDFEGNFHGIGDAAAQTENACKCIKQLLEEAGASINDICKLTVYITDRAYREDVYRVIGKHFKKVYPCSTGLMVKGLALPEMVVEIDVYAVVGDGSGQ